MPFTAKFGAGGTVKGTADRGAAVLDLTQGDHLTYEIHTQGANPHFAFAVGGHIFRTVDSPPAKVVWTLRSQDMPTRDDIAAIRFLFATGALSYKLTVKHVDAKGNPLLTLKELEIGSTDPIDTYVDTIRIFVD